MCNRPHRSGKNPEHFLKSYCNPFYRVVSYPPDAGIERMGTTETVKSFAKGRVAIIDDEAAMGHILVKALGLEGYSATAFTDPKKALAAIDAEPPDLILTDVKMPGMNGRELLRVMRETHPKIPVLIMSAFGTIEDAVGMVKEGAFTYITKPFQHDHLAHQVGLAMRQRSLEREVTELRETAQTQSRVKGIIGGSKALARVRELISRAARTDSAVLVTGESGVGKELVAREIHLQSARSNHSFVAVNCPAIPVTLIESELFGFEKGAFTGADRAKPGLIESSAGGTLFLDEIGEIPGEIQAKLLRVIQEREVQRLGAIRPTPVDLRIIAATNRDLDAEVKAKRFRADLYYRLKVLLIEIPPLRERREDIPDLARYFLTDAAKRFSREALAMSDDLLSRLESHDWPGNIREMENLIERMVAMGAENNLTLNDLPEDVHLAMTRRKRAMGDAVDYSLPSEIHWPENYREAREEFERSYLKQILHVTGGKIALAARLSGLSRRHLYEKLETLGIEKPAKDREGETAAEEERNEK